MLTDIFAHRYIETSIWNTFDENSRRLLVQGFRIVSEQLFPYYGFDGKASSDSKEKWDSLNKQLAMELGLKDLSPIVYGFYNRQNVWVSGTYTTLNVCENFVCADFDESVSADQFIKERLSFIEISFRRREAEIDTINANLQKALLEASIQASRVTTRGIRIPGDPVKGVRAHNKTLNDQFEASCTELNQRFKQAHVKLHYHNGFIQIAEDALTTEEIEQPFWNLVKDQMWQNVDHDMKEALDLRDSNGRDPAWYAAKALESTIKIISDEKGWSRGKEKGAVNYIDNLRSKANGEFINSWERESLAEYFSKVRNPFGHGAGSEKMPELSASQTDWAIEFCMIWIKTLIKRM